MPTTRPSLARSSLSHEQHGNAACCPFAAFGNVVAAPPTVTPLTSRRVLRRQPRGVRRVRRSTWGRKTMNGCAQSCRARHFFKAAPASSISIQVVFQTSTAFRNCVPSPLTPVHACTSGQASAKGAQEEAGQYGTNQQAVSPAADRRGGAGPAGEHPQTVRAVAHACALFSEAAVSRLMHSL